MSIWIGKYKDIIVKDETEKLGIHSSMKGEYRVFLRGSDGRIKYKTDWKPNTLLNNGLNYLRNGNTNTFERMVLGTDDTPVDIIQTGLLGINLGEDAMGAVSITPPSAPNYERISVEKGVFVEGNGTGLVKEFILYPQYYSVTGNGTIRVVLDTPINKQANDQLTIEHRMTHYINTTDVVGVLSISGEAYDYTLRHCNVLYTSTAHQDDLPINNHSNQLKAYDYPLIPITDAYPPSGSIGSWGGGAITTGGTLPNYWGQTEMIAGVDTWAHGAQLSMILCSNVGYVSTGLNTQVHIGKVSDGTPFTKLNTHELRMYIRCYSHRYVP